ncbi:universal stress protein [Brevundimonas sp.]|uniref:universal stress protein n=1 Tax=Brevundimonas sp. TaxID=1871086 RepID=UPI002D5856C7|nr:universal stress protein [Brevundimonas sp.]HYD27686.1 universal stress protein [Brevundimonas sp.]
MTYASLLVAVDDGPESDSRLELACDLANAFNAHLTGLCVGSIAPPLYDPLAGGAMAGELFTLYRDMAEAEVESARTRFFQIIRDRDVEADWRGKVGFPGEACTRAARAADLVILGGRNTRAPYHAPDVADVLMGCGRPVLVSPPTRLRNPVGEHALVAWKDCREARLALAAAIPLLQRAKGVTLYAIRPGDEHEVADAELADVVRYLTRHGIAAEPVVAHPGDTAAGRQILDEALARSAGLIVAGGYGHARMREWALGGVTRDLLDDSTICVCLAH